MALGNPQNTAVLDDLRFVTGGEVEGVLAPQEQIKELVQKHYGDSSSTMEQLVEEVVEQVGGSASARRRGSVDLADAEQMAQSAPIIKLLQYILFQAIRDRASDVHFEPFEDDFKIRYRVDGALYELQAPPRAPRSSAHQPREGHVRTRHRRDAPAPGRSDRDHDRRPSGRSAREHAAHPATASRA